MPKPGSLGKMGLCLYCYENGKKIVLQWVFQQPMASLISESISFADLQ